MTPSPDETCASCRWRMVNPQQITESLCRRFPPVAHLAPVPNKLGQMQPGFMTTFPQVAMNTPSCGEWAPSARMVS